ncbi:MAG: dehydrogenase E1 component subunit alpha/beta [Armatimonadota bacterium]|nr:dehydrogenase E1 component subunit alpha/beta [Armatimonadota bacterium]
MRELDVMPDFTPAVLRFGEIPKCQYAGTLREEIAAGRLTAEAAREMLEVMFMVRAFEALIVDMKNNKFKPAENFSFVGATHLSVGQEAVAVGVMSAIRGDDYITSTHRGHGHSIAKGAYALRAMDEEGLKRFLEDPHAEGTREELLDRAMKRHLYKTVAELFGKEEGYCRGRGGGMHIADFHTGHLGANAIVGGSCAIAAGAAMAAQKLGDGKICVGIIGDGATNNGIFHEACNFAAMGQFKNGIPLVFVIENNQYGMTGQQVGEVTGVDYLARRGAAYNAAMMHAEVVDGMNVLAVRDAVVRAAQKARENQGPVLLEALCYRYYGHSLSDQRTTYRTAEEEEAWKRVDPIRRFIQEVIDAGVMTEAEVTAMEERVTDEMRAAAVAAAAGPDPDPAQIADGLYSNTVCDEVPEKFRNTRLVGEMRRARRDGQGRILYRHAVAEALYEEMLRDSRVIFYGEDVADYGGAFQATVGLLGAFGRERVFNTAISEAAVVGTAVGAACAGLRPVVEIMYIDFMPLTMDQTGNQAAKVRYMFGGKALVPMVIRTTVGGGKGYAGQHSQSLEAMITMFPGLKVVMPSTAYDAKGLLKSAIRDNDPVVFIEHQLLYTEKGVVPEEEYLVPLGEACVRREGKDVTVVAYSRMADVALSAAEMLAAEGISVEVIDPRTLIPFDYDAVTASVEKTGRLLLVTQAPETGCFPEHIAYQAQKRAWRSLKAPVRIVAAYNVPPPMSQVLEQENIPSPEKVARNVRELLSE